MQNILVALDDPALRDQVKTALKLFPGIRGIPVQRNRLISLVAGGLVPVAVILDYQRGKSGNDPYIEAIRRANADIEVLACAEKPERSQFSKAKRELDIFSFIPLPLDPIDLVRRLHRLREALSPA